VDEYPRPIEPFKVTIQYAHIDRLVGKKIARKTIRKILQALEIIIDSEKPDGLNLLVPAYRVDVKREADVIEEILRIYGYNNVEHPATLTSVLTYTDKPDKEKITQSISEYLSGNGFNEIMCNSLSREAYYRDDPEAVPLFNPLSTDLNRMRTTLLYGGLETIIFNINRKRSNLRFYEFGNCYHLPDRADPDRPESYRESEKLALFAAGDRHTGNWIEKERPGTFYELKAYVEGIMERVGLDRALSEEREVNARYYAQGLQYVLKGVRLAELGILDSSFTRSFDISSPVYFAELEWTGMLNAMKGARITMHDIPKYPEVRRDLSMIIDKDIPFSRIRDIARKSGKEMVRSVTLFDVYESEKLEEGKKSYAVGIVLQNESKTLTDKEIDNVMNRIQGNLEKQIDARIRQAT
jgi:phenylalanyl-tRNA synthetase beta chain